MIGINGRCWIDLQTVVPIVGILEEAVHWVQDFVRNIEEPVTTKNTISYIGTLKMTVII